MSAKKLTDSDKTEILKLYRETEETTSTLATRYEVSSSTISRFLKNQLSQAEYDLLIQQKRLGRTQKRDSAEDLTTIKQLDFWEKENANEPDSPSLLEDSVSPPEKPKTIDKIPSRPTKISSRPTKTRTLVASDVDSALQSKSFLAQETQEEDEEIDSVNVIALEEMLGEDLTDLDEDEENDEDDWDDNEDEDEDEDDETVTSYSHAISASTSVEVLPISQASFPRICYLVIDRSAELITRPLKEFADLGRIPSEEVQQKTLPVFDNHRVARRFSNRSQRVIKVPDGRILKKTCSYLKAKGITRLLMDGQVYSLSPL